MDPTPKLYRAASGGAWALAAILVMITFYLLVNADGYRGAAITLVLGWLFHWMAKLLAYKAHRLDEDQHVIMHELDLG